SSLCSQRGRKLRTRYRRHNGQHRKRNQEPGAGGLRKQAGGHFVQASPKHKAYALKPGQRNKNYAQSAYPPFEEGGKWFVWWGKTGGRLSSCFFSLHLLRIWISSTEFHFDI